MTSHFNPYDPQKNGNVPFNPLNPFNKGATVFNPHNPLNKVGEVLKSFFKAKQMEPKRTTYVWCPGCKADLIGDDSFVSDTEVGVHYICKKCSCSSRWLFDCIVPILLDANYTPLNPPKDSTGS